MECFKNIQENIEGQLKKGLITKKEEKSPVKNYQTATMLFDSSPGEPGCDALEKHSSGITECLDGGPRVGFTNRKKRTPGLETTFFCVVLYQQTPSRIHEYIFLKRSVYTKF